MRKVDLTGRRFGKLTVMECTGSDKNGHLKYLCICDCGRKKTALGTNLIRGLTTSCGCVQRQRSRENDHSIDIKGLRFGRLTAIKMVGASSGGDAQWECCCECGNTTVVKYGHLKSGAVQSCGCMKKEPKTHGLTTDGNRPRIYGIWEGMKQRCSNPNVDRYNRYGGRGITVCDEWQEDFKTFYDWAMANGYQDDLTIDRKDNNGNYEPGNCRWVTNADNIRNR
ncbi:MAG: hypothetical protein PHE09_08145 [Oscillospiraceae bacterium]|nr:hypothetical protein [Oscillospiraceae bacterium]